jgi:hypothetical protein
MSVQFNVGCKNCLIMGEAPIAFPLVEQQEKECKHYPEYRLKLEIDKYLKGKFMCSHCGSLNFDIRDIKIDNIPLYNMHEINEMITNSFKRHGAWVILNFEKRNGEIILEHDAHPLIDSYLHSFYFKEAINIVNRIDDLLFEEKESGDFFIHLTGELSSKSNLNLTTHRFNFVGFSKEKILECLEFMIERYNLET